MLYFTIDLRDISLFLSVNSSKEASSIVFADSAKEGISSLSLFGPIKFMQLI